MYPALSANSGGGQKRDGVIYPNVARTLTAEYDASPCVDRGQNFVASFMGGQGAKARSIAYCDDGTTPTIKSVMSGGNTVPDVCYCLQGNGIDRSDTAGCNGSGWRTNERYTLNTIDRPAVVYPGVGITSKENASNPKPGDPAPTISTDSRNYLVYAADCRNLVLNEQVSGTLQAKSNGGQSLNYQNPVLYAVKENNESI